jgi:hypothetical protein
MGTVTPPSETVSQEMSATKLPPPTSPVLSAYNIRSPAFWIVVISVYLAFFLIALDRMIIATAIPTITNDFNSISDIGWYGSAYMLTCAIFNPLFGAIYRFYDVKSIFMASVVLFEAGSALCGAAPTSSAFIAGRAIAGVGAAGMLFQSVGVEWRLTVVRHRLRLNHDHRRTHTVAQEANFHLILWYGVRRVVGIGPNRWRNLHRHSVSLDSIIQHNSTPLILPDA